MMELLYVFIKVNPKKWHLYCYELEKKKVDHEIKLPLKLVPIVFLNGVVFSSISTSVDR